MKHGERRKAQILDAGLQLWREDAGSVTARGIAKLLGLTHTAVLYHCKNSDALKKSIADHAVAVGDPVVVPMLITARHAAVANMSDADRSAYLNQL